MTSTVASLFASLILIAACCQPQAAAAQTTLAVSPALACLTRTDGADTLPAYPEPELSRKEGGVMRVQLEFTSANAAPKVTIVSRPRMGNFDDLVSAHVKQFRVPCMRAGDAPVVLTQEYVFDADQQSRVAASAPRDSADPEREVLLKCRMHVDGEVRPEFPREALRRSSQGTLLMQLRFTSPTLPPEVTAVSTVPSHALERAVAKHLAGMRLPCLQDRPLEMLMAFKFLYDSGPRTVLGDSSLVEVLRAARDLKTPVQFDFNTMQCPFELRLTYHRPFRPNSVQQLDTAVAAREPLMEWLSGLTLNLSDASAADMFGNKFVVSVPCSRLDL